MTPTEARQILVRTRSGGQDFFTLCSAVVDALIQEADRVKYRRPAHANGSRARYFHAYLCRVAARED